jgi:hypothetical protein
MLSIYCCGLPVGSGYKTIGGVAVKLLDSPVDCCGHAFSFSICSHQLQGWPLPTLIHAFSSGQ